MLALLLAAAVSIPARSPADYAILQGRVAIITRSAQTVVIGVDTDGDSLVDDLFWFLSTTAPALHVYADKAAVEYRGDELVIISADTGEMYAFSVGAPHVAQRGVPANGASASYAGYGLNHRMGADVNRISFPARRSGRVKTLDDCDFYCIEYQDYGSGGSGSGSCDNGGLGSTSCSVTVNANSCSVTCTTGYYACCNRSSGCCGLGPPSCSCIHY